MPLHDASDLSTFRHDPCMDFQFVLIGSGEKFKSLALGIENRVRTSRVFPWLKKSRGLFPNHFRARERGFRVFRGENRLGRIVRLKR